ncbi:MAG: calycin-like domain-containing protein [Prevotella sp.]
MKKIFTLIAAAVTALTSMAADYTDKLQVLVNGNGATQEATIRLTEETDGTTTLMLNNFCLDDGKGTVMPVGNIVLRNVADAIAPTAGEKAYTFTGNITIEPGTKEGVDTWLGPMLGAVPVELRASLKDNKLYAVIDINMASLGQIINVVFGSRNYQIPNSGFEEFHTAGKADEPNHWHSFQSATGSLASMVTGNIHLTKSNDVRPGTSGETSVKLVPVEVKVFFVKIWANGTMTTGRMIAGSATASDPKNHAETDLSNTDKDDNGDPFYTLMDGHPDAVKVWAKTNVKSGDATISAVITDGTYYQDPEDKTYKNVFSKAKSTINTGEQWQEIVVPFEKQGNNVEPKAILVTISTNGTPGTGATGDYIIVDDLSLVYNPQAQSIKFNGKEIDGFSPTTYEYTIDDTADPSKISVEAKGVASVTLGEDNKTVTVMTSGEDLSSTVTYTINFTKSTTTLIENVNNGVAEKKVTGRYNAAGQTVGAKQKGIIITRYSDGTVVKTVK